jgi:DMSO reductase anchor subunit
MTSLKAGNARFASLGYQNFRLIWWGMVEGAPQAVLIGAVILGIILVFVMPMFWRRDLPQRQW